MNAAAAMAPRINPNNIRDLLHGAKALTAATICGIATPAFS
jgi:hypothetical protein